MKIADYNELLSITADSFDEKITEDKVRSALKKIKINYGQSITRGRTEKGQPIYGWVKPAEKSEFILTFPGNNHPHLLALSVKVLNNWGYNCKVIGNGADLRFERRQIFHEEEIAHMIGPE